MILLLAGAVTFAFTAVLTIAGVGAAFILIPVFIALGIEVHAAMATALLLNAVALAVATVRNARRGFVDYRTGLPILVVAAALAPLGAWASQGLERRTLLGLFCLFLVFAAAMMLRPSPRARDGNPSAMRAAAFGSGVGAVAGFVGGLLGVGGGNIIAPALVAAGVEPRRASATTSFAVIFSSLAGFLGHATLSGLDGRVVAITAGGSAGGALVGSYLMTDKLKGPQVRTLLGVVLLAVAAKLGWGLLP
ncbi:sulfite exporter TauE/SafE family protein [Anaeromyxobacter terrae]|uniref:sulfite exporter TauE/SafE family protein n=1 Tax=Anaeromyxobacter terrae TaxID=2925406 RepID=UPI001F57FED5|nr:sulfite exporter TauE/SafE family protein [Anaeromyxobacter sp. SG22]